VNSLFPYDMSYIFYSSPGQLGEAGQGLDEGCLQPCGHRSVQGRQVRAARAPWIVALSTVLGQGPRAEARQGDPLSDAGSFIRTGGAALGQIDWIESRRPSAAASQAGAWSSSATSTRTTGPISPAWSRVHAFLDIRVLQRPRTSRSTGRREELVATWRSESKGHVYPGHPCSARPRSTSSTIRRAARRLLKKAGYSATNKPRSRSRISNIGLGQMLPLPMNEYVQENLNAVGFDASFEVMEWNAWDLRLPAVTVRPPRGAPMRSHQPRVRRSLLRRFMRLMHSEFIPPKGATGLDEGCPNSMR